MLIQSLYLHFADVEFVKTLHEVAKGKSTNQSSLYKGKYYPADWAVDGNTGTFSHTEGEENPYWWVDLGKLYRVKQIVVYSRKDCCGKIKLLKEHVYSIPNHY